MTGREMIMYIMYNHLEDVEIFSDKFIPGFMSLEEAAVKFEVGAPTVKTWWDMGLFKGFKMGESIFIQKDSPDPRKKLRNLAFIQTRS